MTMNVLMIIRNAGDFKRSSRRHFRSKLPMPRFLVNRANKPMFVPIRLQPVVARIAVETADLKIVSEAVLVI